MEASEMKRICEAVLFAAGHSVTYERLSLLLELGIEQTKSFIAEYAKEYNDCGRGIQLVTYKDSCQLCTREEYIDYIRAALGIRRGGNLSNSSLEVLSIIAYHQPVTRSFIEQVRGIDSSYAISSLCEKGLIESCGRLEAPGRPSLYATTEDFLRCFGLTDISELPEIAQLKLPELEPTQASLQMGEQNGEHETDENDGSNDLTEKEGEAAEVSE